MGSISQHRRLGRLISRLAGWLRGPLAAVLGVPLGIAGLFAILGAWLTPRRLPDLRRLAADDEFAALQAEAADWITAQFALIEERAPWLDLAGRRTDDWCRIDATTKLRVQLPVIGVKSERRVVGVYGADGPITGRLADLGSILTGAGSEESFHGSPSQPGPLESAVPPAHALWHASWRAGRGSQDAIPPAGLTQPRIVDVGWASPGDPPHRFETLDGRWRGGDSREPDPPRGASRYEFPIESAYADIDELAARALAGHAHVITIALRDRYYHNPDIRRYPLPRRRIPRIAWPPFRAPSWPWS